MTKKLFVQAMVRFALGVVCMGALLFLPAGAFRYWNGWLLMGLLFVPMFCAGIVLMVRNPELLRKRLSLRERESRQSTVIKLSGAMFLVGFLLAGLNFRLAWVRMPPWISWVGAALFLLGYALYGEVLRENEFLSRTVEVQENQRVIDTGLYGVVRHPMYSATLLLFLSMPLILGSLPSLIVFLAYPVIIAMRIENEEQVLAQGLEGYTEYRQRVKFKLLPFVW